MRMVALVVVALVLSGCSDDPTTETTTTETTTSETTTTGTPGGTDGSLDVDLSSDRQNGTAPLVANITLDVAAIRDGQEFEANITWTLHQALENGTVTALGEDASLPFTTRLTLPSGNHSLVATAGAPGYGTAVATLAFNVTAPAPTGPVFADGAEDGSDAWTIEASTGPATPPLDSDAQWAPSGDQQRSGDNSWWSDYPPDYSTTMTSNPIGAPTAGDYIASYWIRGSSEENGGADGLTASIGVAGTFTTIADHDHIIEDWTLVEHQFTAAAGDELQIRFHFQSDEGCDKYIPPGELPCGPGGGDGFYLDDILITPA